MRCISLYYSLCFGSDGTTPQPPRLRPGECPEADPRVATRWCCWASYDVNGSIAGTDPLKGLHHITSDSPVNKNV